MLRIMTLNLNKYGEKHGPWTKRRQLIVNAIKSVDPDILTLQAVRRVSEYHDGIDQASQLAVLLPKYRRAVFQPATAKPEYIDGLAILSKYPEIESNHRPLTVPPDAEDKEPRVMLETLVHLIGAHIHVFDGYFSWVPEQNTRNFEEVLPELEAVDKPAVLAGDFNATPDSATVQRLKDAGWIDSWEKMHPGEAGFTFEADNPDKRIDYIFLSPDLMGRLAKCEIVRGQENGVRMSDHFGLYADIDL